jgi:Domain of unknown function (DUF4168)
MTRKTFPKVYIFDRFFQDSAINRVRSTLMRLSRWVMALLPIALLWWCPMDMAIANSDIDPASPNPTVDAIESAPPPSISLDANTISSEKISQFVHAYWQVLALLGRREAQLHAAETAAESQRLEREIAAEAIAIIENSGLTQSEYLQLLALANTDSEFGERVATQLQEEID